jgi:nuclear pore complex protein Nup205
MLCLFTCCECINCPIAGEAQQSYYPGLPRGLVAILLYYDAKVCMAHSLRTLLQARAGRTWALPGLSSEVLNTATKFTDELIAGGLVEKILGLSLR